MPLPDGVKTVADRLKAARLDPQEDRVRCQVLRSFASGTIPRIMTLAERCGLSPDHIREILRRLATLDLLCLDPAGEMVAVAYPFSATPTPHRILLTNREVSAPCAVDALGIPAMLREEASILSRCAYCGSPVEVEAQPHWVTRYFPAETAVWFPISADDGCPIAESRCPSISFFCAGDHLEAWRRLKGEPSGVVLSLPEAFDAGREIFGALLTSEESMTKQVIVYTQPG